MGTGPTQASTGQEVGKRSSPVKSYNKLTDISCEETPESLRDMTIHTKQGGFRALHRKGCQTPDGGAVKGQHAFFFILKIIK